MDHSLWGHLPLLVRSNSKESVEYILQTLWRTRKTGLDPTDRAFIRDVLQLPSDSDLNPLLVCLRILIRRYEDFGKDEIHKLFPPEVSPELQRLLTLLLQKFQREWRDDARRDQVSLPRLKAMTWNMATPNAATTDHVAVISLKLQDDTRQYPSSEREVKFQLAKDTLDTMLKSMYHIREQLSSIENITLYVGYSTMRGFIRPYRRVRYHLNELLQA
ncbi:COMM domain-containing protein 9 isoform X2 [Amborella trichopoda]|uniref:COMM domain-containing protein 9 isoform X2 n=1 Tax=Amborella trichopoda TaxID=13333 RepID=UPI0009BD8F2A|nr:COMM domain-containing protein 9 isoform X2 [Amborella trichopoda]|eukprot:XP_020519702.1 COMM domain-containing protein 9 isoform X2 [Amborella trichopoda]